MTGPKSKTGTLKEGDHSVLIEDLIEDVDTRTRALGKGTMAKAKLCVLDALACALGGQRLPWTRAAVEVTERGGGSTVWGHPEPRTKMDAVFVNSVASHSIVQEDMHPATRSHMGTVVVPAALAVAEECGSSGPETLAAVVAGYETMAHVGDLLTTDWFIDKGLRPTGFFGAFGAAMAAGQLLGLSREELVSALGLAASGAAGTCEWAYAGTSDCFFQNGMAARAGVQAALLAARGIDGAPSALEGRAGLLGAVGAPAPRGLTNRAVLAIEEVYFKSYPSCAFTQESIEGARRLRRRGLHADEIESLRIVTYQLGKDYPGCDNPSGADTALARQMSCQFGVATMLSEGQLAVENIAKATRPAIRRLMSRITIAESEEFTLAYPASRIVELHAATGSGAPMVERVINNPGLEGSAILDKFRTYAAGRLAPEAIDVLVSRCSRLEHERDLTEFFEALRNVV